MEQEKHRARAIEAGNCLNGIIRQSAGGLPKKQKLNNGKSNGGVQNPFPPLSCFDPGLPQDDGGPVHWNNPRAVGRVAPQRRVLRDQGRLGKGRRRRVLYGDSGRLLHRRGRVRRGGIRSGLRLRFRRCRVRRYGIRRRVLWWDRLRLLRLLLRWGRVYGGGIRGRVLCRGVLYRSRRAPLGRLLP